MKSIEQVGKTVDQAITEALIALGASTDEVTIEVISKGSRGLLGFGAKEAKVRVTLKEIEEENESNQYIDEPEVIEESVTVEGSKEEVEEGTSDIVKVTSSELDRVIKHAEDFLYKLLKEMEIEGQVKSRVVNNSRISIDIIGKNMGIIIGKRGETLDAIQYLVNIVANKERREYIKIMLDTENYRARREETLRKLAQRLGKKVQQTKKPITLEPMNPYDRRIIHSALQESKVVKTHSEGQEPFRRVVISPSYPNRVYK